MSEFDTGQPATAASDPTTAKHLIRAIANRLRQTETYRRGRLTRYARLRTRIKGPAAVATFHAKPAAGTQGCCVSCQYFAAIPQMVCALHPEGPPSNICPDRRPQAEMHSQESETVSGVTVFGDRT